MTNDERRRAVRAPAKLAMEIKLSGKDFTEAETVNVSANGVYFASKVHIPALTKLEITLLLPDADTSPKSGQEVFCNGVVVRTQPENEEPQCDRYEVACYFTSISDKDREHLESYILRQLAF